MLSELSRGTAITKVLAGSGSWQLTAIIRRAESCCPPCIAAHTEWSRSRPRSPARQSTHRPVSDNDDLVAGRDVGASDVDHRHVHADGPDDRCPPAAHEHESAARQAKIEPIGVSSRHDGEGPRFGDRCLETVACASPARMPFTATIRLCRESAGRRRSSSQAEAARLRRAGVRADHVVPDALVAQSAALLAA